MKKHFLLISLLFTALCGTVMITTMQAQTPPAASKKAAHPVVNKPAPDFTLKTPDGKDLALSSLRGHVVLVDFWASWCRPCRATIPHLKEIYTKYHPAGLEILSVSLDANATAWKRAMEQEQMPWPQVVDTYEEEAASAKVAGIYGIQYIPYVLLVDKEGKLLSINPSAETVEQKLKKIFSE